MYIAGMGVVFNRGRGLEAAEESLKQGWVMPGPVYQVLPALLTDKTVLKDARRADDLSKMAVLAAHDAFIDSGINEDIKGNLGIILASAFGPHVTTFRFLDDILTFGDAGVSPTLFSHSVHNAAASYIALSLGSRGPTITVTDFASSFYQALILAESWLKERRCEYILVGSADQSGKVMEYIISQKLKPAGDGKIKPFTFSSKPECVVGEGSVFFLVTSNQKYKKYCRISALEESAPDLDLLILDSDGLIEDETSYKGFCQKARLVSSYAPIFGSSFTLSSFSCLIAALSLKKQLLFAAPIGFNPHNIRLCTKTESTKINKISCLRYACNKRELLISLAVN
jgi:3-oxoacyl-[acyl-carrier-protein] synthase II